MRTLRGWLARWGGLFHKAERDRELAEELDSHVQMHIEENLGRGMSPEEARRQALVKLGGMEQTKENYRDRRSFPWLESLLQDIRFALRMLRKNPGFTAVAVLTLALGIGANTAIFSLLDAVLLRPLQVHDPEHLMVFFWDAHTRPKNIGTSSYGDCRPSTSVGGCSFSVPFFGEMRSQTSVFSSLAAFAGPMQVSVTGNGAPSTARGKVVSGTYFSTVGVTTLFGRPLEPADDSPSAPPALVLTYRYWQSAFAAEASAVGRTIYINEVPFSIVGVTDPHFVGLSPGETQDFYLPLGMADRLSVHWLRPGVQKDATEWWVVMIGRLKPRLAFGQAQAAATTLFQDEVLHGATPMLQAQDNPSITLRPAPEAIMGGARWLYEKPLYALASAVGSILLIACANVAGILLARGSARQKEMAVRLALGGSRGRIIRQLLTESVTLSVIGGAFGVLFALWTVRGIATLLARDPRAPLTFAIGPDWRVLSFTAVISLVTGIFFGLAPALQAARVNLTPALKESSGGVTVLHARRGRLTIGNALVVVQVALAVVVLTGAGLLVRTLQNLKNVNPGFDTRNVLLFSIDPTLSKYEDARIQTLYATLQERLSALPGVISASYSGDAPLAGSQVSTGIHLPGEVRDTNLDSDILGVGPDFFSTMHVPLLAGRTFTPEDFTVAAGVAEALKNAVASTAAASSPTAAASIPAIVNRAFARKFFPDENPFGKHVGLSREGKPSGSQPKFVDYQIVGLVEDMKVTNLRREIAPTMFRPKTGGGASFELRTVGDPAALVPAVRAIASQVDSHLPLFEFGTESEQVDHWLSQERALALLSGFFGTLAVALSCIGLYGLLAYEVTRRTREVGIRMALGAQRRDVLRLVVGRGIALAVAGVAIGIACALGVTRFLETLLFGVKPIDPLTFISVAILLLVVALAACWIPARRAMRVDPMVALRYE